MVSLRYLSSFGSLPVAAPSELAKLISPSFGDLRSLRCIESVEFANALFCLSRCTFSPDLRERTEAEVREGESR